MSIRSLMLAAVAVPAFFATSAVISVRAEDAPAAEAESPVKVTGNFGIYSDYRFRGVSLNDRKFTPQGTLTLTTSPGFYVFAFGSPTNDFVGGTEIDVGGGYSKTLGAATVDVGAVGYIYPKGGDFSYYEIYGSVSGAVGPITPKLGFYFAPKQNALGLGNTEGSTKKSNFYVYGGFTAAIPETPISLNAQIGLESGAFDYRSNGSKIDWQIGASAAFYGLTFSLNYIDSNAPFVAGVFNDTKDMAKGTIVGALTYSF
jgi:uncharacterized protein (TIGR02001 family)